MNILGLIKGGTFKNEVLILFSLIFKFYRNKPERKVAGYNSYKLGKPCWERRVH